MHKDFHKSDVAIAITYGTIAAKHLGSEYAIPRNERIDGIVAVGYPGSEWMQIPPRGPVKAVWV